MYNAPSSRRNIAISAAATSSFVSTTCLENQAAKFPRSFMLAIPMHNASVPVQKLSTPRLPLFPCLPLVLKTKRLSHQVKLLVASCSPSPCTIHQLLCINLSASTSFSCLPLVLKSSSQGKISRNFTLAIPRHDAAAPVQKLPSPRRLVLFDVYTCLLLSNAFF